METMKNLKLITKKILIEIAKKVGKMSFNIVKILKKEKFPLLKNQKSNNK